MTTMCHWLSLSCIIAALMLTRSSHASLVLATVVPLRIKVELILQGDTPLSPLRFHPLEQDLVEFLNRALYPYYGVADATVASQVLLDFSTLGLTWTLQGVPSADSNSNTDFLDQVTNALSTQEFNHIMSDEWSIGTVVSAKASLEPETDGILTNDIFDRTGVHSQAPTPGTGLPTMPPSASTTMSPSTAPNDTVPTDPFIREGSSTPLFSKLYQTNMTITLAGISTTITTEELGSVEWVAEGFFQDYLPLLHNLILDISNVHVSNQALVSSTHRRRLGVREDLVLQMVISGEGWSTHQVILDDVPFDSFVSHAFEVHSRDLFSRLQASSAAFRQLDILTPTISDKEPSVDAPNTESTDDGNQSYVTVAIVVCVCGAILAGVVGGAFYIFRKMEDKESVCAEDDVVQDLVNEESLSDSDISRFHSVRSSRQRRFKYPLQQSRVSSDHSTKSPSMLWDSDVDNWSLTSGPLSADRELFTIQALDEFEASLRNQTPLRGSVENGFQRVDL